MIFFGFSGTFRHLVHLGHLGLSRIKVGTPKMAPDLKAPSTICVQFQNQLCTYLDGVLSETNFDP